MSEAERRPRRIIPGPPLPPVDPALDLATLLQQHRFQRAMASKVANPLVRRAPEPPRERRPLPEPPTATPFPTLAPTPARTTAAREAVPTPATAAPKPRRPVTARAPVASRSETTPDMPDRPDPLDDPQAWRYAGLAGPAPDNWDRDLADRIARLCRRADPSFQSWSVTVPLDPAVLPETELAMSLSLTRLALRFRTHSPYSLALVSRHQKRLVAMLQKALPDSRDIDVETA